MDYMKQGSHLISIAITLMLLTALPLFAQDNGLVSTDDITTMLAFTNVTVIDVEEGAAKPGMSVIVTGENITAVGTIDEVEVPDESIIIDGTGKYLIPGLWDMHVHHFRSPDGLVSELARHVAKGVLGVRDLGIPMDSISRFQEFADSPSIPAPRVWFSGPFLEEPNVYSSYSGRISVTDSATARQAVEILAAEGATSIKVHDLLTPETYTAIARAANSAGLSVVGHIPVTMTTDQVIDAHQHSIEHLGQHNGLLASCSANNGIDRRTSARLLTDSLYYQFFFDSDYLAPVLAGFDADLCADLARRLAEAGVWQVPTLVLWRNWSEGLPWVTSGDEVYLRKSLTIAFQITSILNDEGVPMMAGTDNVGTVHDELELLVEAGLTPLQALRSATINPARFLGREDVFGTVEAGKLADLVLLDTNPLEDISNTKKIRAVVANGRYFDRAVLDRMLTEAEHAVNLQEGNDVKPQN
jgi:hypothetical protein